MQIVFPRINQADIYSQGHEWTYTFTTTELCNSLKFNYSEFINERKVNELKLLYHYIRDYPLRKESKIAII